jgi:hypothetical protein
MRIAAEIVPAPGTAPSAEHRLVPRLPVSAEAALRRQGESAIAVSLTDISTHGFRVEAAAAYRTGRNVWLKLPGIEALFARVVWSDGSRFGCQFATPLHPSVVDRLVTSTT